MKCKKCGAKAKDINGMRKHYLRSHPGAMKRKKGQGTKANRPGAIDPYSLAYRHCPWCGGKL